MDIEFNKLSLNDIKLCNLCLKTNVQNNITMCNDCDNKLKFLYNGIEFKCIYCQFFLDYEYAYICYNCSKKDF